MAPKDVFHRVITMVPHNPFSDWLSSIRFHLENNQQVTQSEWIEIISSDPVNIHHHVHSISTAVVTMRRGKTVGVVSNAVNPPYNTWELVNHRFRPIDGDLLASRAATGESGLWNSTRRQATFESGGARALA